MHGPRTKLLRYTALAHTKFFEVYSYYARERSRNRLLPSTADFKSLEEKILRTIELLKSAREAKAAAERDASRLREQLNEREEEWRPCARNWSACAASAKRYVPE